MSILEDNWIAADNIERIIVEEGRKKSVIAAKAGYTSTQFCDFLNGRRVIRPSDILRISKAIGVAPGELFETKRN